jgi:hypothetical protein
MSESKPITNIPVTLGEVLDKRRTVEERLAKRSDASSNTSFRFWTKNNEKLDNAKSVVQQVLDRYSVLSELNEISGAVSCLKKTTVILPSFVPSMSETPLTLAQLRDAITWLIPHLKKLETHLTSQATQTSNHCSSHNANVRLALEAKIGELKRSHELKVKTAVDFKEDVIPTENDLNADIERERARSETRLGCLIDPVGIRELITSLRDFNKLMDDERNIRIDAANSTSMVDELAELGKRRSEYISGTSNTTTKSVEGYRSLSLAELELRLNELSDTTLKAINHLRVVTLTLSQGGKNVHDVSCAAIHLAEVFHNISAIMSYRQSHHEAMTLTFTTTHPLTRHPLSVDGLVRLGFLEDDTTISKSNTKGVKPKITLRQGLEDLFDSMSSVENNVAENKANYEVIVNKSISEKQEARMKSGAAMRSNELEDIANSVRATDTMEWRIAPELDEALLNVTTLRTKVVSLQSASRKSANAVIQVNVPEPSLLSWVNPNDNLLGW